ncbi:MAG: uroporphyrinogen decarboxylase family protein [Planctomycetota bacterium]
MHPRVERLPAPAPDWRRFMQVLRRERPARVPLIELAVHPRIVDDLLGNDGPPRRTQPPSRRGVGPACPTAGSALSAETTAPPASLSTPAELAAQRCVRLQHRLGYDVVKISAPIPFNIPRLAAADDVASGAGRPWTDEHAGPLACRADVDRFPWPAPRDVDFGPVRAAAAVLPEGMRLIGFSGGVLEFAMDLMGMTPLMIATRRAPEFVAAVIERVGRVLYSVFAAYCDFDSVCALWLGDDLGHKHGLLVSPEFLRRQVVPWYRRFADLAHSRGRPFLLHTCGNTAALMPDLVAAGIDAKHSFEDGIEPVERCVEEWGGRVAVLGGVDVHLLATGAEAAIRRRTLAILSYAAPRGGYAAGSGNSIPDYVPPGSFLAMIEAVAEYNGLRANP